MTAPFCPGCGVAAYLTTGSVVYPNHPALADKPIWKCEVCPDAHVGCRPGTEEPLGTPAGPELRHARRVLHRDMLDPLWRHADRCGLYQPGADADREGIRHAARGRVYAYLAAGLGLPEAECQVGLFSLQQCRDAWRCLRGVTYVQIRAWAKARPEPEKKPKRPRKVRATAELPAPTMPERAAAAISARAIHAAFGDEAAMGARTATHIDYSRPRRAEWICTWASLPGFARVNGVYLHDLLPGWQYEAHEVRAEMIPDLEALAERGVRPSVATSQGVAA